MLSHISPDSPNDGLTNGKINGHLKPGNPGNGPSSMEVFQSLVVITGINQWGSSKYHPHGRDLSCQHLGHEHLHPFTMYISMLKPSFWSLKGIKIIIIHHISRRPSYSSPRSLTSIHLPELHPLTHCKGSNPHHLMDGRWLKKSDWLHGRASQRLRNIGFNDQISESLCKCPCNAILSWIGWIWLGKSPAETTGENYESSRTRPPHFLVQKLDVFFTT